MSFAAKDKKGMYYALAGFSLFSIGDVFIKLIADKGFSPAEIAFFLNLFYLPFLIALSPVIGGIKAALRTDKLWLHVLRALLGVAIFIINVNAFKMLGLSMSYTLIFTAPFFATILAVIFLKEEIRSHRWIAIILGFIGVMIVLRPGANDLDPAAYLVVFGAFLGAIGVIMMRKIGDEEPLMAFSLFGVIISLQVFGVLNFWDGEAMIPKGSDWLYFLTIAVFHMIAMLMTARAFSMADTALVAPFQYVQLLWGTGFGILVFSSVPDIWTGIGATIIVFSGIYMIYREKVRKQEIYTGATSHGVFDQE
jgi:drug/metabolite transporter (DMT)-like permease